MMDKNEAKAILSYIDISMMLLNNKNNLKEIETALKSVNSDEMASKFHTIMDDIKVEILGYEKNIKSQESILNEIKSALTGKT